MTEVNSLVGAFGAMGVAAMFIWIAAMLMSNKRKRPINLMKEPYACRKCGRVVPFGEIRAGRCFECREADTTHE